MDGEQEKLMKSSTKRGSPEHVKVKGKKRDCRLVRCDELIEYNISSPQTPHFYISGYSGSDMKNLVKDASMGPLRDALKQGVEITKLNKEDMRHVTLEDFKYSVQEVRPSVSFSELGSYEQWNKQFGSLSL